MEFTKKPHKKVAFYRPRKKVCVFCAKGSPEIDYKDISRLSKFISEKGKILPRRATGLCAKHQRRAAIAIKKAREMALLPYVRR
jgi:small subunit ribosomal protein S18